MAAAAAELPYDAQRTDSWLVCSACGTQFPTPDREAVTTCVICDDPRQYTPQTGQTFTTLAHLRAGHRNVWIPLPGDHDFTSIVTEPKFAIGQRAVLIKVRYQRGSLRHTTCAPALLESIASAREAGMLTAPRACRRPPATFYGTVSPCWTTKLSTGSALWAG